MTLLEKGAERYWFLYEGTPAGKLELERDYWVDSEGTRRAVDRGWWGDLPDPEWVYFGKTGLARVLYLVHHQADDRPDQFWQMEGRMTVFGFGREYRCCTSYLEAVPATFTVGLLESSEFREVSWRIESAWRDLTVSVESPEIR